MDDKELLELAAHAFGILPLKEGETLEVMPNGCFVISNADTSIFWNPRDCDADAFRLAVQLNIQIAFYWAHVRASTPCLYNSVVEIGKDRFASARLAITQAAAEMEVYKRKKEQRKNYVIS